MCGIVGIVNFDDLVSPAVVRRMSAAVSHRGPDGEGFWEAPHVALGCRRLAVVDVQGGTQPACNEAGSIQVLLNGEIYNHRELRSRLAIRGHRFRNNSDVDVISHLYEEFGTSFVNELDGDFAIALWSSEQSMLMLARDPVGVKPLFYHLLGRGVVFASEAKGIFASGTCSPTIDVQGLSDCFAYGQTVSPGTFWSGVQDLLPGTFLTVTRATCRTTRYFRPLVRRDPERPFMDGQPAIEAFEHAFVSAVRKRLPDEVKAGACLSGGLDSSAVVGVAARACSTPLPTFSIRLPGEDLDEGRYSTQVASRLGLANHELHMTGADACELLPATMWHLEAPQWFGVAPPFLGLSRFAKKMDFTVGLTGDGADELLGGYDFYRLMDIDRWANRFGIAKWQAPLWRRASRWLGAPTGLVEHILETNSDSDALIRKFGEIPAWIYVWNGAMDAAAPLFESDTLPLPTPLPRPAPSLDPLRRRLHFEFVTRLPNWVLLLSDRLSMASGIEVRVPFMDRQVLELCAELAPQLLMRRGIEKYIVKRSLRSYVPAQIRHRRKKPFFTPVGRWYLSGPGAELAAEYLSEARARRSGLFEPRTLSDLRIAAVREDNSWHGLLAQWVCMMVMSTHMLEEQYRALGSHPLSPLQTFP
jgi:asparagine synthase (glutamine-hydrolysing)